MRFKDSPTIGILSARVEELSRFAEASRGLQALSIGQAEAHIDFHHRDLRAARKNIAGLFGAFAPHQRCIDDESPIIGRVGEPDKPELWRAQNIWIGNAQHVACIRYNQPITRPGKPVNALGSSGVYLSFEAISKAQIALGIPNAQGRKVSPGEHVKYLERVEALSEYIDVVRRYAPINPDELVQDQERGSAGTLGPGGALSAAVFSNILGTTQVRAAYFAKAAEREQVEREPSIELHLGFRSELMRKLRSRLNIPEAAVPGSITPLVLRGAEAVELAQMLGKMGWRDRRTKDEKQNRQIDSMGVRYDPGKSGTVQYRLIGELPANIEHEGRIRIVEGLCQEFEQRDLPYVAVIHAPGPENNDCNWHFHLVYHDRPFAIFDGTAASHVKFGDANGEIPDRKIAAMRRYLNEPAVQAQVGKWDFEVEAFRFKKRQRITTYPYLQRKDRHVTRKAFVPGLRSRLCDLTNAEFERAGINQRVDPSSNKEAKRPQEPGRKLGSALFKLEMSGVPTDIGSDNEDMQWDARKDQLDFDHQVILQRSYVTDDEFARICAKISDKNRRAALLKEIVVGRREIAELRHIARHAREVIDRLTSRPKAVAERNRNLMIAALDRKNPDRHYIMALDRQVSHAHEHNQAMKLLGGDLFQIGRDADREIAVIEMRLRSAEREAGLRPEHKFDVDIDQPSSPALSPVTETSCVRTIVAEKMTQVTARANTVGSETQGPVRNEVPVREIKEPLPPLERAAMHALESAAPTPVAADQKLPPSRQREEASTISGPENRRCENTEAGASRTSPSHPPRPHKSQRNERARRREVGEQIKLIARHRVPFRLTSEIVGGAAISVAVLDPAIAAARGLPDRIEAITAHEEERFKHIVDRNRAFATLAKVPMNHAIPDHILQTLAAARNTSPPPIDGAASAAAIPTGLAQEALPSSRPAGAAQSPRLHSIHETVRGNPPVPTPPVMAAASNSSPSAPAKSAGQQPAPPFRTPASPAPPSKTTGTVQMSSQSLGANEVGRNDSRDVSAAEKFDSASPPRTPSMPPVAANLAHRTNKGRDDALEKAAGAAAANQVRERAANVQEPAPRESAQPAEARPVISGPKADPQELPLRSLQAEILDDIDKRRTLVFRDRYGRIRINDERTDSPAMAAWVVGRETQAELERKLNHQDDCLKGIGSYILYGQLAQKSGHTPGYSDYGNRDATRLLHDWDHNPVVADGLKYLASLPFAIVPDRDILALSQKFGDILAGSAKARAEVIEIYRAYRASRGLETHTPAYGPVTSKALERSCGGVSPEEQSSMAKTGPAPNGRTAGTPQLGRGSSGPDRQF